jgi:hypothetical protein
MHHIHIHTHTLTHSPTHPLTHEKRTDSGLIVVLVGVEKVTGQR